MIDDKGTLLEQRFSSQNNNRPCDVYHPNFLFGRSAYFDLTIRNTVQVKFVANSANSAGSAAAGELEKDLKYAEAVADSCTLFFPLAVETYGCWTPPSLDNTKTIASKVVTTTSIPFTQAYSNLMQQLSVNLWKCNACMIQSRLMLEMLMSSLEICRYCLLVVCYKISYYFCLSFSLSMYIYLYIDR